MQQHVRAAAIYIMPKSILISRDSLTKLFENYLSSDLCSAHLPEQRLATFRGYAHLMSVLPEDE